MKAGLLHPTRKIKIQNPAIDLGKVDKVKVEAKKWREKKKARSGKIVNMKSESEILDRRCTAYTVQQV